MFHKKMIAVLIAILGMYSSVWSVPMGTAFDYRGKLNASGASANGLYNFQFSLYDAVSGGTSVGTLNARDHVTVTNGMFTVRLDFGAPTDTFNGSARWLQIAVQPDGGSTFTTLSPRQPTPLTPYALYAVKAGSVDISPWNLRVGSVTDGDEEHANLLMFSYGSDWKVLFSPDGGITTPNFDVTADGDIQVGGATFEGEIVAMGGISSGSGTDYLMIGGAGIGGAGIGSALNVRDGLNVGGGVDAVGGIYTHESLHVVKSVYVDGDLNVSGIKNFVQAHPTDPTKEIGYTCLEGPEAGTYIRGSAELTNGEATIDLPEHFRLVTGENGVTAQVTPRGEWLQLYVATTDVRRIVVREAQGKNGRFDYLVQGIRKGYENQEVIRDRQPTGGTP